MVQRDNLTPRLTVHAVNAVGYRSLRSIWLPVAPLSVYVGSNGVGKTNLYQALQLIQAAAAGTLSSQLALEGGMASAFWAGSGAREAPGRIVLSATLGLPRIIGADGAHDHMSDPDAIAYTYSVSAGVTSRATPDAFFHEPQIKEETLSFRYRGRTTKLLERRGPSAFALDREGKRQPLALDLMAAQTALGAFDEPQRFPELHGVQQAMQDWRFYHDFRTDVSAPVRQPCLAVSTLLLASDGANLAAVFATLVYIRQDRAGLDEAIESAFPGARLHVPLPEKMASFGMIFPDHPHRVFEASELSDGTLRFLLLAGALLSSRLPRFIALNEPESSLHPDLLVPLAKLIVSAAKVTQIWLVTHSTVLAEHIRVLGDVRPRTVIKQAGETWIKGLKVTGEYDDEQDDGTADDERDDAGAD